MDTQIHPGGRRISSNSGSFRGSVRILQDACREEGTSQSQSGSLGSLQRKLFKLSPYFEHQPFLRQVALSVPDSEGSLLAMLRGMIIEGTTSCTGGNIDPPVCLAV